MTTYDQSFSGVIFNLDGVLVDTSVYHYAAWRRLENELGFDINQQEHETLRGLSRMASLEKILEWGNVYLTEAEKLHMSDVKNNWYKQLLVSVTPDHVLAGVVPFLTELKGAGFKIGLSSASKSARMVLNSTHLTSFFDVIIDGHSTRKSKPDPECFLMASRELGLLPTRCVVFEDSHLGVQAGLFGDFTVIGVGSSDYLTNAHAVIPNFENLSIKNMLGILADTPVISS